MKGARKAAGGGPRAKERRSLRKSPMKKEPTRTPMTPRARRISRKRATSPIIYIS